MLVCHSEERQLHDHECTHSWQDSPIMEIRYDNPEMKIIVMKYS